MTSVKQRLSEWLNLEQKSLNEISLEDIEFMEVEEQKVNQEVAELLSFSNRGNRCGNKDVPQVRIPTNPDTDSNPFRTPIPIESGHLFQSKADTPKSERSDAEKLVNVRRYFSILLSI